MVGVGPYGFMDMGCLTLKSGLGEGFSSFGVSGFLVLLCLLGAVAKPPLMKLGGNHV